TRTPSAATAEAGGRESIAPLLFLAARGEPPSSAPAPAAPAAPQPQALPPPARAPSAALPGTPPDAILCGSRFAGDLAPRRPPRTSRGLSGPAAHCRGRYPQGTTHASLRDRVPGPPGPERTG